MNTKERETMNELIEEFGAMKKHVFSVITKQNELIDALSKKIDADKKPFNLEEQIVREAKNAINTCIVSALSSYHSPLTKIVHHTIDSTGEYFTELILKSIEDIKKNGSEIFEEEVKRAMTRNIISSTGSVIDSVIEEMKRDQFFRAKLKIAVNNVVEEWKKGI